MPRVQRSIQAFARASKPASDFVQSRKRKQISEEGPIVLKKQKVQLEARPETSTNASKPYPTIIQTGTPITSKCFKRKRAASPEADTQFVLPEETGYVGDAEEELPEELDDLEDLQVAFLRSLALYYAHHGSASPTDVQVLLPTITRIWGKRKATRDDIQLCLGVTYSSDTQMTTQLTLSHYGHAKYCVEMESRQRKRGGLAQAFNETELQVAFKKELQRRWRLWTGGEDRVADFISALPRSTAMECPSYTKLKPALAKGQQRLDEVLRSRPENQLTASKRQKSKQTAFEDTQKSPVQMENFIFETNAARDQENKTPPPVSAPLAANFRALSLLDRIQKKQEINNLALAHKPTRASIDRLAALQRVEEMVQILELLATQKGTSLRASFPLPALVRTVQTSIRSPMSTEEVERCIAVIGKEVAPGYVEKKEFGSMKAVVVNRMFKPDMSKVREMVERAEAGTI